MKAVTTIITAALLAASIGIAGAQTKNPQTPVAKPPQPGVGVGVPNNPEPKNPTTEPAPAPRAQDLDADHNMISGNAAFCLKTQGGRYDCQYATAAACQQEHRANAQRGASCEPNPDQTTGQGQN